MKFDDAAKDSPYYAELDAVRNRLRAEFGEGRISVDEFGGCYSVAQGPHPDGGPHWGFAVLNGPDDETTWMYMRWTQPRTVELGSMDDLERGLDLVRSMAILATESLQGALSGPKAAMDTDSSNGAPGAPVGASNGRT